MSKFMLNDDDAINDVNPFVTHDFSLPGGVRQTGNFEDFEEVKPVVPVRAQEKSVFCSIGLCEKEKKPLLIEKDVHPKRNFSCYESKPKIKVGISNKSVPWRWILIFVLVLILTLLFLRR